MAQPLRLKDIRRPVVNVDQDDEYDLTLLPLKATKKTKGRPVGAKDKQTRKRRITTIQPSSASCAPQAETCEDTNVFSGGDEGDDVITALPSHDDMYKWLIQEHRGMHMLNSTLTTFTLADFDVNRSALKMNKYVIVTRRAIQFCDSTCWLYGCLCDMERARVIDVLDSVCTYTTFTGLESTLPDQCLHVRVLTSLMESVDAIDNITPTVHSLHDTSDVASLAAEDYDDEGDVNPGDSQSAPCTTSNIHQLAGPHKNDAAAATWQTSQCVAGTATLWAVSDSDSDSYGVVEDRASVDVQRCLTCPPSHASFCVHVTEYRRVYVAGRVNIASQQTSRPAPSTPSHQKLCRSTLAIPYESTPAMHVVKKRSDDERFGKDRVFEPVVQQCQCGSLHLELHPYKTVPLYLHNKVLTCTVMYSKCMDCATIYHYDGLDKCLINMDNFLIAHEVLRRYTYQFFYGRATLFTEYNVLKMMYQDNDYATMFRYQHFKDSWFAFIQLLDIDYATAFMCPECGREPPTIVIDATCLAFKKSLLKKRAVQVQQGEPYDSKCKQAAMVKGRTLLHNDCRVHLMAYVQPRKGITTTARDHLLTLLTATADPPVTALITYIISLSVTLHDHVYVNPIWRDFVSALASSNPLCGFFPPDDSFFDILTTNLTVDVFQKPETLVYLQKVVPILFNLLSRLNADFPFNLFVACIPEFRIKTNFPFTKPQCPSEPPSTTPSTYEDLTYFPNLPILRTRGLYLADRKTIVGTECNKLLKDRSNLLPGVFTLYCVHGICYGFQVMEHHESPNVPYTIMRTRFHTPPNVVIYDNACKLHTYSLNRDSHRFRNTVFRVDRLHFKNHTACGAAYELNQHPSLSDINSQVVEQANSRLQKTKSSLSFMTQDNFMKCARLFMFGQNRNVLNRMRPPTT